MDNISREAIETLGSAAAYVTEQLAFKEDLKGFLGKSA